MALAILLLGGAISLWSLWLLKRWWRQSAIQVEKGQERLVALVEELVSTAEATVAMVAERTEGLADLIHQAEAQTVSTVLRTPAVEAETLIEGAWPDSIRSMPPAVADSNSGRSLPVHAQICQLSASGYEAESIARELHLSKAEVQLVLNVRQTL